MADETLRRLERGITTILALSVIASALDMAVADSDHRRKSGQRSEISQAQRSPIRTTPTFEAVQAIVADIRGQRFNADAEQSGDTSWSFLDSLDSDKLRSRAIKRSDVDLDAGRIIVYRHKTDVGFCHPDLSAVASAR